jgi:hypothetical protein
MKIGNSTFSPSSELNENGRVVEFRIMDPPTVRFRVVVEEIVQRTEEQNSYMEKFKKRMKKRIIKRIKI